MIADNIIDRNANWKGDSAINGHAIDLFGKEFGSLGSHDGLSKLANVHNGGSDEALGNNSLEREIDNFGSFLVLGADIAVM